MLHEDFNAIINAMQIRMLSINARIKWKEILERLTSGNYTYEDEIFKLINETVMADGSQFRITLKAGEKLYRAREIDIEDFNTQKNGLSFIQNGQKADSTGYNDINSREVPIGKSKAEGRNNLSGVSYLYLANTPETACAEIKSPVRSLISLAEFELQEDIEVVDFAEEKNFLRTLSETSNMSYGVFFTELLSSFTNPNQELYRFTQIISDYIRRYGVDGIAYRSFYTFGTNYTVFNSNKAKFRFIGSKILLHAYTNETFWDFDEGKAIKSFTDGRDEYKLDVAERIIKNMSTATV